MSESLVIFDPEVLFGDISFHNVCSASPIWGNWYPRLRLAIFALFLVFYVFLIPALAVFAWRKSRVARRILAWYSYGTAIVFMFFYLVLAVIGDALLNCLRIGDLDYLKIYTAVNVFRDAASIMILGVVLFAIIPPMLNHAQITHERWRKYGRCFVATLLALVSLFCVVHLVLWNFDDIHSFTGQKIVDHNGSVSATYTTLYMATCLSAAIALVASCIQTKRKELAMQGLFPYGIFLAISLLAFSLDNMIAIFGWWVTHTRAWTKAASVSFGIVNIFFQACIFAIVPILAMSKALADDDVEDRSMEKDDRQMSEDRSTAQTAATGNQI